jgi:flagellar hook-associated protein 2
VLLGDSTTARIRTALYRIVSGSALNVDSSYQYLSQVGIGVNSDGQLTLDESEFREALANDPQAVEDLFAAYDVTTTSTQTLAGGVTVSASETTYNALGFGSLFDRLLEELTDSVDGTVTLADDAFQTQIDLLESRIEDMDERLEAKREALLREFTAMEMAIARLQDQGAALTSLAANVQLASSQFSLFGT